jgi:hypothetical protein
MSTGAIDRIPLLFSFSLSLEVEMLFLIWNSLELLSIGAKFGPPRPNIRQCRLQNLSVDDSGMSPTSPCSAVYPRDYNYHCVGSAKDQSVGVQLWP